MTIEALLGSIDSKLAAVLARLEAGVAPTGTPVAAPVETPVAAPAAAPKRRGRPAADATPAPAAAPAPAPAAPAVDPFDDAAPAPEAKVTKDQVRASMEALRTRLKNQYISTNGDDESTAQNKATTRALAWLKEVTGFSNLASLTEDKYALVVNGAPNAK